METIYWVTLKLNCRMQRKFSAYFSDCDLSKLEEEREAQVLEISQILF